MADLKAVAALLLETQQGMCADCIMLKAGVPPAEIRRTLERLAGLLRVVTHTNRCAACSKKTTVFAFERARFILGDLVSCHARPDWVGEVVDTSRLRHGHVSVRWRTPSGMSMSAMEERIDALFPLPPIKGGAAAALSWEAMLALHRASVVTQRATSNLRACGRELCAEARRLRRIAARTIARTRALRAPISALRVATAMSERRSPAGARLAVDTLPARR